MRGAVPDISIVIPTRDEGEWLRRTIDGVLATTAGHNFEVIVVDDGSVDGSAGYLRGPDAPSAVHLIQGGELGVARARNRGAEHARGAKLVFLDANVVPDPGWLDAISAMLDAPDSGLVGVGVRDFENAASVGYSCIFVDERLQEGWSPRPASDDPFEVACIIGCCCGIRRDLFESLGCFDAGHVRWGVEDLELSLRCWFTGHRNLADPSVQVAHFFKHNKPRNYSVSWQQYDHNLLRCVLTYFTGRRAAAIFAAAAKRPSYALAAASGLGGSEYWLRRRQTRSQFTRDEDAFFTQFGAQFARFEARIAELTPAWPPAWSWDAPNGDAGIDYDTRILAAALACLDGEALEDVLQGLVRRGKLGAAVESLVGAGYFCREPEQTSAQARAELAGFRAWTKRQREASIVPVYQKVICPSCGATNLGVQDACVLCSASLPVAEPRAVAAALDLPAQPVETPAAERLCSHCNANVPEGVRFCVECGTPVDAAPPPATPAVCSNCQASLVPNTRFCVNCGSPVTA